MEILLINIAFHLFISHLIYVNNSVDSYLYEILSTTQVECPLLWKRLTFLFSKVKDNFCGSLHTIPFLGISLEYLKADPLFLTLSPPALQRFGEHGCRFPSLIVEGTIMRKKCTILGTASSLVHFGGLRYTTTQNLFCRSDHPVSF